MDINEKKFLIRYDEIVCEMSRKMLSQTVTRSITVNFIKCIIPHHTAIIYMCDSLIRNSRNEDMIEYAMNIAENRRNEIIKLQSIMRNNQYINDNKDVEHHNVAQYMITNEMIAEIAKRCQM